MAGAGRHPAVEFGRRTGRTGDDRGPAEKGRTLTAIVEDLSAGPLRVLWICAVAGWTVVGAGLWRGLHGPARKAALTAHGLTLGAVPLFGSVVGFGLLHMVIAGTALWWSLLAVTGMRPERLVDPPRAAVTTGATLRGLGLWLALGGTTAWLAHWVIY